MNFKKEIKKMSIREVYREDCEKCLMHKVSISGRYHNSKIPEELSMYEFEGCLPSYLIILLSVFSKEKAVNVFKRTIDRNVFGFPCKRSKEIFEYIVREINSKKLDLE